MHLALSVEALSPPLTGIGRYTWELTQQLAGRPEVTSLRFFHAGLWVDDLAGLLSPTLPSAAPHRRRRVRPPRWVRDLESRWISRNRLFHGPNYFLPAFADGGVITVHDLSIFMHPQTHTSARRLHFDREFARSIDQAAHIITDSCTVRDEVIAFTGFAPDCITAVPLGVSAAFRPQTAAAIGEALSVYGLAHGGYGLCVSTLDPRKKIGELLQAWRALPRALRNRRPLVVVGGDGWLSDDLQAEMIAGAGDGWIRYLGYVPEADLPALYAGAALFVYPSIYEGFGLPPIEAMASGVPVVVSNSSCLPEVTKGAALLVEPMDIPGFAQRLEIALTDPVWRREAIARGLAVAGTYSWDRCGRETLDVYRRVWGRRGGLS